MDGLFQSFAEIPGGVLPFVYAGAALACLIFAVGVSSRASVWTRGRNDSYPLNGWQILWQSLTRFFAPDCLFARRVFANSRARGLMLSAIVWSIILLAFGVAVSAFTFLTNTELDTAIDALLGLAMDLAGGMLLLGLAFALTRRFLIRPARYIQSKGDVAVMLLFFLVVLSGLILESTHVAEATAFRSSRNAIAMLPPLLPPQHGEGAMEWYWQPFGSLIARLVLALGIDADTFANSHLALYLVHASSAFLLIAYLPFSKLFHMFAAPITTYARSRRPSRGSYPLRPRG